MADDSDVVEPTLRNRHHQRFDQAGQRFVQKTGEIEKKAQAHKSQGEKDKKQPAGGFDETLPPHAPPGYTLRFKFHRARHLPFADISTLSSDPYVIATLSTDLQKRHKDDPDLKFRTPTVHRNTDPEWNAEWVVGNVPASGFFLKCRLYDEDPNDHDDRLGNVHVSVNGISDSWPGIKEQSFEVKMRMGSKRAYFVRGCATLFSGNLTLRGEMTLSVENLGKTPGEFASKTYTIGPLYWSRHFSPLIGRLTGVKNPDDQTDQDNKKKTLKYNFQAIQMQLSGPVPDELYHRYVEFKPFVAGMFTAHSLRGRILHRALRHQHARIYNYDRSTIYGVFPEPSIEVTQKFLEFVHHDQGGRIFTYVITLDGQWRFTETGKEFGIDLLSKHTMHSDVNIYIAFSGEFFIRKLKKPPPPKEEREQNLPEDKPDNATLDLPAPGPEDQDSQARSPGSEPNKDPRLYELIIDNDSGTYRPNGKKLHVLRQFMEKNLPGLKVRTLDCQADEEKMNKMKDQQRERKKKGEKVIYQQNDSDSSISSSDEERLDRRAAGLEGGKVQKRIDQMRQRKENLKNITSGQVGARKEDGTFDRREAPIVDGDGHHESTVQGQPPVSSEQGDGQPREADGELTNGGQGQEVYEPAHQTHQGGQQAPLLSEKTAEGNGDMPQPYSTPSYQSQATTTG